MFLERVKMKIFRKYACAAFMQTLKEQSKTPQATQKFPKVKHPACSNMSLVQICSP